jgi:hypothetical protein
MLCDVAEFEDLQFFIDRRYSSHNPREKSPVVFGLVILRAMVGNCLLQSICSESICLKADRQCYQNVGHSILLEPNITRQLSHCAMF